MSTPAQDKIDAWHDLHHAGAADLVGCAILIGGAVVGVPLILACGLLASAVGLGMGMRARARAGDSFGPMWTGSPEMDRGFLLKRDWAGRIIYDIHGEGRYAYAAAAAYTPAGEKSVTPQFFTGAPASPLDPNTYVQMPLYERLDPPSVPVDLDVTRFHPDVAIWTEDWPAQLKTGNRIKRSWAANTLIVPLADWDNDQWVLQQSQMEARRRSTNKQTAGTKQAVVDAATGASSQGTLGTWHPVSFFPDWAPGPDFDIRYPGFSSTGPHDLQRVWIPVTRETGPQRL
jgi:hypothetical protein